MDGAGQAYVTGYTWSADFPASLGPGYDTSLQRRLCDAFVVKLDAAGTGLLYATFLGGSGYDWGYGIAVDGAGQAYVTGGTESADFPASLGPGYDTSYNGGDRDAFVVKLDAAGTGLLYATFLGGSTGTGATASPWTAPARPTSRAIPARRTSRPASAPATTPASTAASDAFVVKLLTGPPPPPAILGTIWHDLDGDANAGRGRARHRGRAGLCGAAGPPRGPLRDLRRGWELRDRAGRGRHVPGGAVRRAGGDAAHHQGLPPARKAWSDFGYR